MSILNKTSGQIIGICMEYLDKDSYIAENLNDSYKYHCYLCNKTPRDDHNLYQHCNSRKHIKRLNILNKLREINIKDFLKNNKNYINSKSRTFIKLSPLNIENDIEDINPLFLCPISREIMKEPVLAADGHTYDKENIEEWFKRSSKSPMTNEKIDKYLTPNIVLYNLISENI